MCIGIIAHAEPRPPIRAGQWSGMLQDRLSHPATGGKRLGGKYYSVVDGCTKLCGNFVAVLQSCSTPCFPTTWAPQRVRTTRTLHRANAEVKAPQARKCRERVHRATCGSGVRLVMHLNPSHSRIPVRLRGIPKESSTISICQAQPSLHPFKGPCGTPPVSKMAFMTPCSLLATPYVPHHSRS